MTLYDDDFVTWTRQQADALRTMPANSGLDIDHLVDEIEGLGRTAIADLSNTIRQVLRGLIRRSIDPSSVSIEDICTGQSEAIIRADAGVWRHVDLDRLWWLAKRSFDADLPDSCPFTIEQMIAEDFDVSRMAASLRL
ncbi:DUF29 family protein [Rhizobium bangladeshense]|uniref:DUF29 family protein n=1 Tax=Rhizobium bangladeshense TaxID=1138189 RepID=A0ABS7LRV2_9HYPH|nr:DUF29 family protein [Rhizobium bangladeshense]MBY3594181.1 DUF29 family protein [Rhizobium bangladeshense]